MTKPLYAVIKSGSLTGTYDNLVDALGAMGEGTVYERLGASTRIRVDNEAKLLTCCRKTLEVLSARAPWRRLRFLHSQLEEAVASVERYNAELTAAVGREA